MMLEVLGSPRCGKHPTLVEHLWTRKRMTVPTSALQVSSEETHGVKISPSVDSSESLGEARGQG